MSDDKNERCRKIGSLLKEYRQRAGLSISETGALLGAKDQAIRAWESGRKLPDADMFLQLCMLYGVNHLEMFTDEAPFGDGMAFLDEMQLLSIWREAPDSARQKALKALIGYDLLRVREREDNVIWADFSHD